MLKWLDVPPVWLLVACAAAWAQKTYFAFGLSFGNGLADLVGGLLVGAGVLLMLLALYELRSHQTTVIPHQEASALVTTGIFSRSRNPIYLGDVLVLSGLILYWDSVVALPLIPGLFWVLETRFIVPEEAHLRRKFVAEFTRYAQRTRRWL